MYPLQFCGAKFDHPKPPFFCHAGKLIRSTECSIYTSQNEKFPETSDHKGRSSLGIIDAAFIGTKGIYASRTAVALKKMNAETVSALYHQRWNNAALGTFILCILPDAIRTDRSQKANFLLCGNRRRTAPACLRGASELEGQRQDRAPGYSRRRRHPCSLPG